MLSFIHYLVSRVITWTTITTLNSLPIPQKKRMIIQLADALLDLIVAYPELITELDNRGGGIDHFLRRLELELFLTGMAEQRMAA